MRDRYLPPKTSHDISSPLGHIVPLFFAFFAPAFFAPTNAGFIIK